MVWKRKKVWHTYVVLLEICERFASQGYISRGSARTALGFEPQRIEPNDLNNAPKSVYLFVATLYWVYFYLLLSF
jgi:hypothetical protein